MFEPILQQPNLMTGIWRRFGVTMFEGKVTVEDMAKMEAVGVQWLKKNPGKVVEMVVIHPSETRMTSEERTRMARVIKRWEDSRVASATVILATGLTGSMHRSVLTGFQLLVPPPHPTKVFGTVAEALTWLSPFVVELCGVEATHQKLMGAVGEMETRWRGRA